VQAGYLQIYSAPIVSATGASALQQSGTVIVFDVSWMPLAAFLPPLERDSQPAQQVARRRMPAPLIVDLAPRFGESRSESLSGSGASPELRGHVSSEVQRARRTVQPAVLQCSELCSELRSELGIQLPGGNYIAFFNDLS